MVSVSSTTSWRSPAASGDDVQPHVREDVGDLEGVDEVGFARMAHLSLVLEGGEHVRPPQQLQVRVRVVAPDLFDDVLESDHGRWCLIKESRISLASS